MTWNLVQLHFVQFILHCTKNENFLLIISSTSVSKSAVSYGFGHSLMKTSFFVQCCTFQTIMILYYPFLSYRANVLCICQMNWVIITQEYSFLLYYGRRQHQGSSLRQVFLNLLLHKRLFKIFCLNLVLSTVIDFS